MRRALSTSPDARATIWSAVVLTMPPVGIRSVESVYSFRSASESGGTAPGLVRSIARSRVANRLTTSTTGAGSPSAHSTCSICAPYFASRCGTADLALVFHSLPSGCIQSRSSTAGNGTHACTFPDGLTISTRVVISNLRQASGLGANGVSAKATRGSAAPTASAAPVCKNSRLCMASSPEFEPLTRFSIAGCPGRARRFLEQVREYVHHIFPRPVYIAFGDETSLPAVIEHDGGGQRMDAPSLCDRTVPIEQYGKGHGIAG